MPGKPDPARLLVLMAKQPLPGRTKTRLTPPLTEAGAADLYRAFLSDKIAQMERVPGVERAIAYTPAGARAFFARLAPTFALREQTGTALPGRLVNVFEQTFEDGYTHVMAIDGDTPTLPPRYLRRGFKALEDPAVDVVLGPCADGGYYAIGMKRAYPSLFEVQMSTPRVVEDTLARARAAGLRVHPLPEWWDVDRPADLEKLAAVLNEPDSAPGFSAPATRRLLDGKT